MARVSRFFFMHLGSFVAVFVYFGVLGAGGEATRAVPHAMRVGLAVMTAYVALAWSRGEAKHFDAGLWTMFALGTVVTTIGPAWIDELLQVYSGTLLFGTLALTALVSLLVGREPFTMWFARRQLPRWQLEVPETADVVRVMAAYWVGIFALAAALTAWGPRDWRFAILYPNLLVFALGMTATVWLPLLYFRVRPPAFPRTAEALIMGMPFAFDRRAARDVRATIQFCVTGDRPGEYHVRIERGRCRTFEGRAPAADLTVHTPGDVWLGIVRGDLDGERALMEGRYRADGDLAVLTSLAGWFPSRR
jgi:hypothetical protein